MDQVTRMKSHDLRSDRISIFIDEDLNKPISLAFRQGPIIILEFLFLDLNKIRYLLSIADVYCMPSVSEPFGLSAVEAVQFGVPCVISKQSGVAEVLSGSLKFDSWDIHKAADYILNLLKDPILKHKIVSDANENLKYIGWDLSAKKVMEAYKKFNIFLN